MFAAFLSLSGSLFEAATMLVKSFNCFHSKCRSQNYIEILYMDHLLSIMLERLWAEFLENVPSLIMNYDYFQPRHE